MFIHAMLSTVAISTSRPMIRRTRATVIACFRRLLDAHNGFIELSERARVRALGASLPPKQGFARRAPVIRVRHASVRHRTVTSFAVTSALVTSTHSCPAHGGADLRVGERDLRAATPPVHPLVIEAILAAEGPPLDFPGVAPQQGEVLVRFEEGDGVPHPRLPGEFQFCRTDCELACRIPSPGVDRRPANGGLSAGNLREIFDGIFEMPCAKWYTSVDSRRLSTVELTLMAFLAVDSGA
eukprot:1185891-Prorocentrum_minimum.AAC.2